MYRHRCGRHKQRLWVLAVISSDFDKATERLRIVPFWLRTHFCRVNMAPCCTLSKSQDVRTFPWLHKLGLAVDASFGADLQGYTQ